MKICVTGGLGYIGRHIVDLLCIQGHDVFVIDQNSYGKLTPHFAEKYNNVSIHINDIFDMDLTTFFKEHGIESVIHLASETSVRNPVDPSVHVLGLCLLVHKAAIRARVKTFVHAGSAAAQHCTDTPWRNTYGHAKLALEAKLQYPGIGSYQPNTFNLRLHNPYGHSHSLPFSDHKESLWFNLIKCMETGDTLQVRSSDYTFGGTCVRDWINIFDVADIFVKFATMDHPREQRCLYWDVGTGIGINAYSFIKQYITVEDIFLDTSIIPHDPEDPMVSVSNPGRTFEYINFRSKVGPRIYSNSYLNGVYLS